MPTGNKDTPQKKYFASLQKRYQSPLAKKRTWDVSSTRKVSSPFRRIDPSPLRSVSRSRSPEEGSSRPDSTSLDARAQLQTTEADQDDIVSWMKSIKLKALNILETEKLEERKFEEELERERSLIMKTSEINTESFDRLKSFLDRDRERKQSDEELDAVGGSGHYILNHEQSIAYGKHETEQYAEAENEKVGEEEEEEEEQEEQESDEEPIPLDATVLDVSSDSDEEEEEEEPFYDPDLFDDPSLVYKPTVQSRSMYDRHDPFGSNPEEENSKAIAEEAESEYDEEEVDGAYDSESELEEDVDLSSEFDHQLEVEQENMKNDMGNFDILASAALKHYQEDDKLKELTADGQATHSASGDEQEPEAVVSLDEEFLKGPVKITHSTEFSDIEERRKELPNIESERTPPASVEVNEVGDEEDAEEEQEDKKGREEDEEEEKPYVEQQYYDSDNQPFQDPVTSIFGDLSADGLIHSLEAVGDSASPAKNILDDSKEEEGNDEPMDDTNTEDLINKEPEIEEPTSDSEDNESAGHESFASFLDNSVLQSPESSRIKFADASSEFLKSVSPKVPNRPQLRITSSPFSQVYQKSLGASDDSTVSSAGPMVESTKEVQKEHSGEKSEDVFECLADAVVGTKPEDAANQVALAAPVVKGVIENVVHAAESLANTASEKALGETVEEFVDDFVENVEEVKDEIEHSGGNSAATNLNEEATGGNIGNNLIIETVNVNDYVYDEDYLYAVDYPENNLEEYEEGYDAEYDENYYEGYDGQHNPDDYCETESVAHDFPDQNPPAEIRVYDENMYDESDEDAPPEEASSRHQSEKETSKVEEKETENQASQTPVRTGIFGWFNGLSKFFSSATIDSMDSPPPPSMESLSSNSAKNSAISPKPLRSGEPEFNDEEEMKDADDIKVRFLQKAEEIADAVNEFIDESHDASIYQEIPEPDSRTVEPVSEEMKESTHSLSEAVVEFVEETANIPGADEASDSEESESEDSENEESESEESEREKSKCVETVPEADNSIIDDIKEPHGDPVAENTKSDRLEEAQTEKMAPSFEEIGRDTGTLQKKKGETTSRKLVLSLLDDLSVLSALPSDNEEKATPEPQTGIAERLLLDPTDVQLESPEQDESLPRRPLKRSHNALVDQPTLVPDASLLETSEEERIQQASSSLQSSPRKKRQLLSVSSPNKLTMVTRSGRIIGAQTEEEIEAAEAAIKRESALLEEIAHGDKATHQLKELVTDYEYFEGLEDHLKKEKESRSESVNAEVAHSDEIKTENTEKEAERSLLPPLVVSKSKPDLNIEAPDAIKSETASPGIESPSKRKRATTKRYSELPKRTIRTRSDSRKRVASPSDQIENIQTLRDTEATPSEAASPSETSDVIPEVVTPNYLWKTIPDDLKNEESNEQEAAMNETPVSGAAAVELQVESSPGPVGSLTEPEKESPNKTDQDRNIARSDGPLPATKTKRRRQSKKSKNNTGKAGKGVGRP